MYLFQFFRFKQKYILLSGILMFFLVNTFSCKKQNSEGNNTRLEYSDTTVITTTPTLDSVPCQLLLNQIHYSNQNIDQFYGTWYMEPGSVFLDSTNFVSQRINENTSQVLFEFYSKPKEGIYLYHATQYGFESGDNEVGVKFVRSNVYNYTMIPLSQNNDSVYVERRGDSLVRISICSMTLYGSTAGYTSNYPPREVNCSFEW